MAIATRNDIHEFLIAALTARGNRALVNSTLRQVAEAYLENKGPDSSLTYDTIRPQIVRALKDLHRQRLIRFHAGGGWANNDDIRFYLTFQG